MQHIYYPNLLLHATAARFHLWNWNKKILLSDLEIHQVYHSNNKFMAIPTYSTAKATPEQV